MTDIGLLIYQNYGLYSHYTQQPPNRNQFLFDGGGVEFTARAQTFWLFLACQLHANTRTPYNICRQFWCPKRFRVISRPDNKSFLVCLICRSAKCGAFSTN